MPTARDEAEAPEAIGGAGAVERSKRRSGVEQSGVPIAVSAGELDAVAFDADGLVPAVIQEAGTNAVLMVAWMDREALSRTFETGRTWFWSRSRREHWRKGDTSGDRQWVREAYFDCDMDVLLFVVEQEGRGACHTGERSCFFRAFGSGAVPGPV